MTTMTMIPARQYRNGGFAFVITLALFLAITVMIAAALQGNTTQRRAYKNRLYRTEAQYMAESALHETLHSLSPEQKSGTLERAYGRGNAVVTWAPASDAEVLITVSVVSRPGLPGAPRQELQTRARFDPNTGRAVVIARE